MLRSRAWEVVKEVFPVKVLTNMTLLLSDFGCLMGLSGGSLLAD
jgi:hypothetical protein